MKRSKADIETEERLFWFTQKYNTRLDERDPEWLARYTLTGLEWLRRFAPEQLRRRKDEKA
jgi:lysyl-tRNA synthetase class I